MKVLKTEEAAGHVLCHDITQIIPGRFKGTAFRKAPYSYRRDIPVLFLWVKKISMYGKEKRESSTRMKQHISWRICALETDWSYPDSQEKAR